MSQIRTGNPRDLLALRWLLWISLRVGLGIAPHKFELALRNGKIRSHCNTVRSIWMASKNSQVQTLQGHCRDVRASLWTGNLFPVVKTVFGLSALSIVTASSHCTDPGENTTGIANSNPQKAVAIFYCDTIAFLVIHTEMHGVILFLHFTNQKRLNYWLLGHSLITNLLG